MGGVLFVEKLRRQNIRMKRLLGTRTYRCMAYFCILAGLFTCSFFFHPATLYSDKTSRSLSQKLTPHRMSVESGRESHIQKEHLENVRKVEFVELSESKVIDDDNIIQSLDEQLQRNDNIIYSPQANREQNNGRPDQDASNEFNTLGKPMDDTPERELYAKDFQEAEADAFTRSRTVQKVCAKYGLGRYHSRTTRITKLKYPPTANYDVLYIDKRDALTWCPVYKAASTSWLHNLCSLAGVDESDLPKMKGQISTIARRLWPQLDYDDASQAVPKTTKFMIVRHPFERIVSAYRDKLENLNIGREHGTQHFYEKYGKKIVQKYRQTLKKNIHRSYFEENSNLPAPRGIEPTFQEFVKYLIDTDLVYYADDHWMPYYLYCTPCFINYDIIAKFETLERDQRYLIHRLNLEDKISPKWKHLTKGKKTSDIVKIYMKYIDKTDIIKLADKYRIDFEMYNYTISDYI